MTQVNRIKYEDAVVKLFDGRSKVAEVDLSALSDKEYFAKVESLETMLQEKLKWGTEGGQWRAGKDGEPCEVIHIEKCLKSAGGSYAGSAKPKKEKADKKPRVKQERDPNAPKKRMIIDKELRVRKSARTPVEDALDAFVIEMSKRDGKGRRMLILANLDKVAAENGIVVRGYDNGHKKMNVQNSLRARYNRGDEVFVNGKRFVSK